jgi:hypothetical protein
MGSGRALGQKWKFAFLGWYGAKLKIHLSQRAGEFPAKNGKGLNRQR